uniref:Uncharacterized protein n=1 Tax=Esox lucius TaxID=8010 RepID=A0AAY5LAE7_ESOLU
DPNKCYNTTDLQPATYTKHDCRHIVDLISDYKGRLAGQYVAWISNQVATGLQLLTLGNDNIIKAVQAEAETFLRLSQMVFNQTHTEEQDLSCFGKTARHAVNYFIVLLELDELFQAENLLSINYAELLITVMMYNSKECVGCIGFYVTFPLVLPEQVFQKSFSIYLFGVVVNNQVVEWDYFTRYFCGNGTDMLVSTISCFHDTASYLICTCKTLQFIHFNDTKHTTIHSQHGYANSIQVSNTQWCAQVEVYLAKKTAKILTRALRIMLAVKHMVFKCLSCDERLATFHKNFLHIMVIYDNVCLQTIWSQIIRY